MITSLTNPQRLDALARCSHAALEASFAGASVTALEALNGDPFGRVLHVCGWSTLPVVGALVRAACASRWFAWEGKSFSCPAQAAEGRGFNRMRLPARHAAFQFRVYPASSRVDGNPVIAIDYDVPTNPWFARPIYDELRSLGRGLYLGRGMRRARGGIQTLLWFAVDTTRSHPPLSATR